MKPFSCKRIPSGSIMVLFVAFLLVSQGVGQAEVAVKPPSHQMQLQQNIQVHDLKLCPDLKVNLTVVKGSSGLVTVNGTVTNVGGGKFETVSEAQVIMNLSYSPQYSYAKTGVSDILLNKPVTKVKPGASIPINCTFQIPNFNGWVAGGVQGNAKRLFTLRVIKQDMSTFTSDEDCNPADNTKSIELAYREKQP
ncbi:MAG: hypothetical protein EG824_04455 [Deltaproteobacteria bacterium]|nr:hypothetical protein [Deltaproteobacteria bacterium]